MKNQTHSSTYSFLAVAITFGLYFGTPYATSAQQVANTDTSVEFTFPLEEGNVWTYRLSSTLSSSECRVIACDLAKWEVIKADSTSEKGQCGQILSKRIENTGIRESTFELCMKDNVLTRYPGTLGGDMFRDGEIDSEILADFNKNFCDDSGDSSALCESWPVRVYTDKVDTLMRKMQKVSHPFYELYSLFTFAEHDGYKEGGGSWGYQYDLHGFYNGVGYGTWASYGIDNPDYSYLSAYYINGVLTGDTTFIRSTSVEMPDELPREIQLSAYPNPFNPTTTLNYEITDAGHTSVRVFDVHGRLVATLVDQVQTSGAHQISFDARSLSSGVYLVELQSAGLRTVQKITLMK
ncbi:MAG: T9SS type A sorting domain-containing protein [Balneolales bacterium]|nr:T9SS type A sorting domain-containing protein [Balneolales bacterium]